MLETLLTLDARYSGRLRVAEKPGLLRQAAIFFAHSGDSWFWGLGAGLVWLLAGSDWKLRTIQIVLAIAVTAAVTQTIKYVVRRERPQGEWGRGYRAVDPHSFPSGHATRAFMLAVLATALGPGWFGLILWVWAPLVALARVAMGVHYLSDILAGAVLGLLLGLFLGVGLPILDPIWPGWLLGR